MKKYEIKCEPVTPGYYSQPIWQNEVLNEKLEVVAPRTLIKESEFIKTGDPVIKYNIYYYDNNGILEDKYFHSYDGINGEIKSGYEKKV